MFYETLMEKKAAKQRFQKLRGLLKRTDKTVSDERKSQLAKAVRQGLESGDVEVIQSNIFGS